MLIKQLRMKKNSNKEKNKKYTRQFKKGLFLLFLISFTLSMAQTKKGKISIKVEDNEGLPLEFTTVILYKTSDTSIVKGELTDEKGIVTFENIPYGVYFVRSSYVGFKEDSSDSFSFNENTQELLIIKLKTDSQLDEVIINVRKKLIERKIDRVVLNIEASLSSEGGSLADVLKIAPGVTVGNNGSISLRGKSGVIILIDGRASYLTGANLENYINSMPANQFSKLEIMTNPPAKYDAEGNAGVINIITKRTAQQGWSFDLSSSYKQGKYAIINNGIGANYNSLKWAFFSNINYNDQSNFDDYQIDRIFKDNIGNIESIYDQSTYIKIHNKYLAARLGMDYFINNNTTVGVLFNVQTTNGISNTTNNTLLKSSTGNIESTLMSPVTTNSDYNNIQANVHFNHKLDSIGKNVSLDLDYLKYDSDIDQRFNNKYLDRQGNLELEETLFNVLPQTIDIFNAKVDYTHPLSEDLKIEIGAKISFIDTDNNAKYYEIINNQQIENTDLSNYFTYKENINAAYINYSQKIEKWMVQAGLRYENTSVEGDLRTLEAPFKNNYNNLLPSLFINYQLDDETTVGVSYGRRLGRPNYKDLNPFRYYYDALTYEEGNPNLKPQISDNFELKYAMFGGGVTATTYYNITNDVITDVIFQNSDLNETYIRKENVNNLKTYGISIDLETSITDNWSVSMVFDYSQNSLEGSANTNNFDINVNTFTAFMLHQYKFEKTWAFELGAWYNSKSLSDIFIQEPYGRLSLAIGKTFNNGKGKIRLSTNDIFDWTNFKARSGYPNTDVRINNEWQTRTIRIALTYKIGGYKTKKVNTNTEYNRIKKYDKK